MTSETNQLNLAVNGDGPSLTLRWATKDDAHLPAVDHTQLSAINTCPTWGIVNYVIHKRMPGHGRETALEAGEAAHDCFAAVRLFQLAFYQDKLSLAKHHSNRIFGEERSSRLWSVISPTSTLQHNALMFCLEALASSGYFDDPNDTRRTISNMETSLIGYLDAWDWKRFPVWIRDLDSPTSDVGIEIPFEIAVFIQGQSEEQHAAVRFTGRIDGIHVDSDGKLIIHENKTASRLNSAWAQSFLLSHQVTGYTLAASLFADTIVSKAVVIGLTIPLPKRDMSSGLLYEHVSRSHQHLASWIRWITHTLQIRNQYQDTPLLAPKYTHSCNRYFRPCSLIPLCYSEEDEQKLILQEMEHHEWSPLKEHQGD